MKEGIYPHLADIGVSTFFWKPQVLGAINPSIAIRQETINPLISITLNDFTPLRMSISLKYCLHFPISLGLIYSLFRLLSFFFFLINWLYFSAVPCREWHSVSLSLKKENTFYFVFYFPLIISVKV